jgi:hypothetical protein
MCKLLRKGGERFLRISTARNGNRVVGQRSPIQSGLTDHVWESSITYLLIAIIYGLARDPEWYKAIIALAARSRGARGVAGCSRFSQRELQEGNASG